MEKIKDNILSLTGVSVINSIMNPAVSVKSKYFGSMKKIREIFPDEILCDVIAKELNKKKDDFIICEELYYIKNFYYKYNSNKKNIKNYDGIEYLQGLDNIVIEGNDFSTIPRQFQYLTNLKRLHINYGNLTEIPIWIKNLVALKDISFISQEISILKEELFSLKSLKYLNVSNNKIVNIPEEIGGLVNLKILNLSFNNFKFLPINLTNLKNIKIIDVSSCSIFINKKIYYYLNGLSSLIIKGSVLTFDNDSKYSIHIQNSLTLKKNKLGIGVFLTFLTLIFFKNRLKNKN